MSNRAHNFCAGPAALPTGVLQRAQAEMLNWQNRGVAVMEMSHRHQSFMELVGQAETNCCKFPTITGLFLCRAVPRHSSRYCP